MKGILTSTVSLFGLLSLAAAPVSAQSTDNNTAQAAPEPTDEQVRDIIVTGEKTERSLQETITSVGIITRETIEAFGITSLSETFNFIANVNLSRSEGGFSIRRVPFDNVLGAGIGSCAECACHCPQTPPRVLRYACRGRNNQGASR